MIEGRNQIVYLFGQHSTSFFLSTGWFEAVYHSDISNFEVMCKGLSSLFKKVQR